VDTNRYAIVPGNDELNLQKAPNSAPFGDTATGTMCFVTSQAITGHSGTKQPEQETSGN